MANEQHLALLRQGTEIWNAWRKQHPEVRPDFYGADLREVDLVLANLAEADLSHADLSYADLSFADLHQADLSYAILSVTDFSGSNLNEASLYKAILQRADLSGADLYQADLCEADLSNADFSGTNLREAVFSRAVLANTNLQGATVEQTLFGGNVGLTEAEMRTLETSLTTKGAIFQTLSVAAPEPITLEAHSKITETNGNLSHVQSSTKIQNSIKPEDLETLQDFEEIDNSLGADQSFTELPENTFTIAEGLTEAFFNKALYISVRVTRPNKASFTLGAVGQPSQEIESAETGDRVVYLNKFEVYLVSVNETEATFMVHRVSDSGDLKDFEVKEPNN